MTMTDSKGALPRVTEAKTAVETTIRAAEFVRDVVEKVENLKFGMPTENPIRSHFAWVGEDAIAEAQVEVEKAEEEAGKVFLALESAEANGDVDAAAAALAKVEAISEQAERIATRVEAIVERAEIDEDELGGPPDEELSDPDNPSGYN